MSRPVSEFEARVLGWKARAAMLARQALTNTAPRLSELDILPTSTGSVERFDENLLVRSQDRDRMRPCRSGQF